MPDLILDIQFTCRFTQKEFSVMTRALAGHELKEHDLPIARELNRRLLQLREMQCREYARQSARALEVALEEMKDLCTQREEPMEIKENS